MINSQRTLILIHLHIINFSQKPFQLFSKRRGLTLATEGTDIVPIVKYFECIYNITLLS